MYFQYSHSIAVLPVNLVSGLYLKWAMVLFPQLSQLISNILERVGHTMDLLWERFQWILPLYMKPFSRQSKASDVCSVAAAMSIDFCLKILNVFSQHIGKKTNAYLNSAEQIPRNWNFD